MSKQKELREILLKNPDLDIKFLASTVTEDDYSSYIQNIVKITIADYLVIDGQLYTSSDEYGEYLHNGQGIPLEGAYKMTEVLTKKVILVRLSI